MNKVPSVTYFNQSLGAVHSECWSKYTFFTFHEKREKEKKQEKKKKKMRHKHVLFGLAPKPWSRDLYNNNYKIKIV